MNGRLVSRIVIFAVFLASFISLPSASASDRTFVPVASYLNRAEVIEKEGKRAAAILKERKVTNLLGDRLFDEASWSKWTALHGADSAVIFVPRDESAEARVALARAIKTEGLRITLRSDTAATVTPESILDPNKKR